MTDSLSKHGWQFALSTMLAFVVVAEQALAQPQLMPRKKYSNDNEYVPEQLKDPPDLPYLPPYPGAKYSNILCFRRMAPQKPGYSLTFHAKETPEEVLNFYRAAFKQNKWGPQALDDPKSASGTRLGAVAVVNVMRPILKGYKTQVYLVYKVYGKIQ